ncbi:PREDICTED: dynein light chain 4, axonemal [Nicrophorus vespilloides]|uniref:Dynein light chain n=1 Tax=Nicrophorus vespilloides TaxID=110193 RepID=A0ABM1MB30_NICVS|nr:PREDICTED: dynein light chain 4, axonemal [Nicrophorus vespilloides]
MADAGEGAPAEQKKIVHTYPLVKNSDMPEEMKQEAIDMVVTACEKFASNNEAAAKMIKDQMDKKFGPPFHVVVGEGYGFEISYECLNLLYMFFGGNVAVIIWKC